MYIHYTLNTTQYTLNTTQYTVNTYRLTGLLDGISAGAFFDFFVFSPFTAVALSVSKRHTVTLFTLVTLSSFAIIDTERDSLQATRVRNITTTITTLNATLTAS